MTRAKDIAASCWLWFLLGSVWTFSLLFATLALLGKGIVALCAWVAGHFADWLDWLDIQRAKVGRRG